LIELSTRQNFAQWLTVGVFLRGWARSALGNTTEGISWIEDGTRNYRANGAVLVMPYLLALRAKALYFGDHTSEALGALNEAEALTERFEQSCWCAELHRIRSVFFAAMGAEEVRIEVSFCAAIRIANEQKLIINTGRRGTTTLGILFRKVACRASVTETHDRSCNGTMVRQVLCWPISHRSVRAWCCCWRWV
jgi:hypothetical protein